jgi:long-chain fatty acid transport protein
MKKHFLAASLLMSAMASYGAGYQLNLQGLRQLSMGGTGTAWPWDASTIYYNPGGLARLHGIQAYVSMLTIFPSTAFGNQMQSGLESTSAVTASRTFVPFNIYIGGPIQEDSKFAVGMGVYTAAGIGMTWDDNWLGKYLVQSIDMKAVYFQPTLSYRVNEGISVGAGFIYGMGSLDLRQALPVDGEAHLNGNSNGVGFNVGVNFKPSDVLQFGITYRSQVNMGINGGSATFTVPASLATSFPTTHFDTNIPMPLVTSVGIGYRPADPITLQFDLSYTGWNSYDSLRINFSDHSPALQNMHMPRHYRNTLTPRLGACYKISHIVSIMAGGAYDPTPVTSNYVSPDLPDADRIVATFGVSVKPLRGFTILAAFEGTGGMTREANYAAGGFSGVYKSQAITTGLGIYYNF